MKRSFYLTLISLILIGFSCKKSDTVAANQVTKVTITVKNAAGAPLPNIKVYQMDDKRIGSFGYNPVYAQQTGVTDENGNVVFIIDPLIFTGSEQHGIYFFLQYAVGANTNTKQYHAMLKKFDIQAATLVID
ncbi:MAG: hypothetical protein ABI091_30490 [Ferruginibacter sp.]